MTHSAIVNLFGDDRLSTHHFGDDRLSTHHFGDDRLSTLKTS